MRNCSYASCGQWHLVFYNSAYGFGFLQIFQIVVTFGKYNYHITISLNRITIKKVKYA